jgi:hypothetical protein
MRKYLQSQNTRNALRRTGTILLLAAVCCVPMFAQGPGQQFANWLITLFSGTMAKALSLVTLIGCLMGLHRNDGQHTGKLLTGAIVSGGNWRRRRSLRACSRLPSSRKEKLVWITLLLGSYNFSALR